MKSGAMIDMGMKRKDMYPSETASSPKSEKDYEKEKVYPEMHLEGPLAEMMGAEDLKAGDVVEQTVRWRVKSLTKTERDGKASYSMTLCLEKASDCKECEGGSDDSDEDDGKDGESSGSAAMDYIRGQAKNAE